MIYENSYDYQAEIIDTGKKFMYAKTQSKTRRTYNPTRGFETGKTNYVIETPDNMDIIYKDIEIDYSILLIDEGNKKMKVTNIEEIVDNEQQLKTVGYADADKLIVITLE